MSEDVTVNHIHNDGRREGRKEGGWCAPVVPHPDVGHHEKAGGVLVHQLSHVGLRLV